LATRRRQGRACRRPIRPSYDYTTRVNLVAVISNGTAILGLGNLGALASKPVMEGVKQQITTLFAGGVLALALFGAAMAGPL
jgi:malic enzyme